VLGNGSVAQSVEQRPFKALVPGSSPGRPNFTMAWVYIGSTDNLGRRIAEHQRGSNHTTHRLGGGVELFAQAEVSSISEARALELKLKRKKNPKLAVFFLQSVSTK
jgi:predicted GIY-YIG superfamily endonuclease